MPFEGFRIKCQNFDKCGQTVTRKAITRGKPICSLCLQKRHKQYALERRLKRQKDTHM